MHQNLLKLPMPSKSIVNIDQTRFSCLSRYFILSLQKEFIKANGQVRDNEIKYFNLSVCFFLYLDMIDGAKAPIDAIDVYDVMEIVRRLSGSKFSDGDLKKIAEAVCYLINEINDKFVLSGYQRSRSSG